MDNKIITVESGIYNLDADFEKQLIEYKQTIDALKRQADAMEDQIKLAMEQYGLVKIETPSFLINYIAQTDRETFDSKKFKADNPDLYDEYIRITPVKASVRIKLK